MQKSNLNHGQNVSRVNVKLPTIEVRFKNLSVEAKCQVVEGKPLPTLWNTAKSMLSVRRSNHPHILVEFITRLLIFMHIVQLIEESIFKNEYMI